MKNPITQAREQLNLTVKEMSLLAWTVEVTLRTNEKGDSMKITKKILDFLVEQGFDKEELERKYTEYRKWKAREITKKMRAIR